MNFTEFAERLYALGYKDVQTSDDQYKVLLREEPFLYKIIIISENGESFFDWKNFLAGKVLPLRNDRSAFTVAILLPAKERVSSFLAEFNWVDSIWSIAGYGVKSLKKTGKAEQHWLVEERVITSVLNRGKGKEPARKEEVGIYKFSCVPYIFFGLNLLMFLIITITGGSQNIEVLIKFGAKYNPRIWMGESWRLFTPLFLHAGFLHFAMNSYALYQLGRVVDRLFGSLRLLLIYFISGIFGSAASALIRPDVISVGASGAIFGLLGALVYFSIRKPATSKRFFGRSLWMILGLNLFLGFTVPGIDYIGHFGGFMGGIISGTAVGMGKKDCLKKRWIYQIILMVTFLGLAGLALTPPKINWYQPLEEGRIALQIGDNLQAITSLERSFNLNPNNSMTKNYLLQAYAMRLTQLYEENNLEELVEVYRRMIRIENDWRYHFDLGAIYYQQKKYTEAKKEFEKVLTLNPGNEKAQSILAHLEEMGY